MERGLSLLTFYLSLLETEEQKQEFSEMYTENKELMYFVAYKILKDAPSAEDAVHQSFLKIIEAWDTIFAESCPQKTSLCVITCKRVCFDVLKKNKSHKQQSFEDTAEKEFSFPGDAVDEVALGNLNVEFIMNKISDLPEIYRDILQLHLSNDLSAKQIAKTLNMPYETVKKRIQRGKQFLIEALNNEEDLINV